MARITTARTFYDLSEALVAKALVEQHGIVVFLFDAGYVTINWPHMFAVGGLRLAVLDTELDATTAILSSKDDDEIGDDSDRCPSCRSGDVMCLKSWMGGLIGVVGGRAAAVADPAPCLPCMRESLEQEPSRLNRDSYD